MPLVNPAGWIITAGQLLGDGLEGTLGLVRKHNKLYRRKPVLATVYTALLAAVAGDLSMQCIERAAGVGAAATAREGEGERARKRQVGDGDGDGDGDDAGPSPSSSLDYGRTGKFVVCYGLVYGPLRGWFTQQMGAAIRTGGVAGTLYKLAAEQAVFAAPSLATFHALALACNALAPGLTRGEHDAGGGGPSREPAVGLKGLQTTVVSATWPVLQQHWVFWSAAGTVATLAIAAGPNRTVFLGACRLGWSMALSYQVHAFATRT